MRGWDSTKEWRLAMNNILEMRNIRKSFSGVHALKGVDFSVQEGEIHALVGENGAGKSSLIKIMTGVYTKDAGTIFSVSYTHLDVYKRQQQSCVLFVQ